VRCNSESFICYLCSGQEEGAAGFDGEVKITPFNMKEELEEGHFDTDGNYHWKKEAAIRDNWLENIDWVKVGVVRIV
jgi:CD2 antigen cytoplasmic tail-binding protein 2